MINDFVLMLRYSDFNGVDTIEEHRKVIKQYGYCWWAKLGKTPSSFYVQKLRTLNLDIAFLYTANTLHQCRILEISNAVPLETYPNYYNLDIFPNLSSTPSLFLKITDLEPIPLEELDNYLVLSSGKSVPYTLKKSISSYFLIQNKSNWTKPIPKTIKNKNIQKENLYTSKSSKCKYKMNNLCSNKSCVNYGYECERPSMCLKFKSF